MKSKKRKSKIDIVKLIFILGLLLIIIDSLFDIILKIFMIDMGWFLIYVGCITYFIIDGKPLFKSLKYLKEIKNYVWFSLILFFGTGIFGYFFPVFFEEKILNLLREIISQTEGLSTLELIEFIFMNNLQSSFFAMLFGVVLGFVPFLVIVINGYILGFVASKTVALEGAGILWELLPHGIFELPAVFISTGLGLKLGLFLFVSKKRTWKEFGKWLSDTFRVFVFIVIPLLVIAAIIEGSLIIFLG